MSEFSIGHHHEKISAHEHIDIAKEVERNFQEIEAAENRAERQEQENSIEHIRDTIESESTRTESVLPALEQANENKATFVPSSHANLKRQAYEKTLTEIQNELPNYQKTVSKLFHQPAVEAVSEALSKTVARPVSTSIGAVIVSIGISISLYLSYRYGFEFNYLLFLILFIAGYGIGIIAELVFFRPFRGRDT